MEQIGEPSWPLEMSYYDDKFFEIFRYQKSGVFLREEVKSWLDANVPKGDWSFKVRVNLDDMVIYGKIEFRSKEKAALFKLFWL